MMTAASLPPHAGRYPDYELRPGGADVTLGAGNCAAYVAAVVEATLGAGVARQVRARCL